MASDGSELLEHGSAKCYPGGLTSEDERTSPRWQKLLAVATCSALLVSFGALGRATAQLDFGWVQLAQTQMPQGLQHKEWEQTAIQPSSDLGPVHPKPVHLEVLHLADWKFSDACTLHVGSGARKQVGAEMPAELHGIIQTWSEQETAKGVLQTAKYKGGSAKKPTGELDHIRCLYTADWAAFYFVSDGDKDAPIVFLLDGLIMHKHYGDKLEWLPRPRRQKGLLLRQA